MCGWVSGCVCVCPCIHSSVMFCLVGTIQTSFCPITFKLHKYVVHDDRRNPTDFGSQVQRSRTNWHFVNKTLWAGYTLVFAQSLSNFTCKLFLMRGGTLLILGHGVRGQGQIWQSIFKTLWTSYTLQFLLNHFHTLHVSRSWWEEKLYWFWVMGLEVKVKFGSLSLKPFGHATHYNFCSITFKRYM